jgi:YesN/AraC family two-component response regulator
MTLAVDGLARLAENKPDVIITDVEMPLTTRCGRRSEGV